MLVAWAMASKRKSPPRKSPVRRWSQHVTETSNALDLEPGVFTQGSPRAIAASLKRSAERSDRKKTDAFRSAMSMLTFYVNRAGKGLSKSRQRVLAKAKEELRILFGRSPTAPTARGRKSGAVEA